MSAIIVGVHGIAQEQFGRHQLEPSWAEALSDGIELWARSPLDLDLTVRLAFYGDLFLKKYHGNKSPSDDLAGLSQDDQLFISAALEEAGGYQPPFQTKIRLPGNDILRRADQIFGDRASGLLYIGELQQVRRYLTEPAMKLAVESRVDQFMSNGARVLIGHSLGSIVAFEYLRVRPDVAINTLVTIGSPLGLRLVRNLMEDPLFATDGLPGNVANWINIYDKADPVACAGPLKKVWPSVKDFKVHNGSKPHSAMRYLGKERTGGAVAEAIGFRV